MKGRTRGRANTTSMFVSKPDFFFTLTSSSASVTMATEHVYKPIQYDHKHATGRDDATNVSMMKVAC